MPAYMMQIAYSQEGWSANVKSPQNRLERITPSIEQAGGKVIGSWLSFGEYDIVLIIEIADNIAVASLAMSFAAGGSVRSLKTTPLISWEDGVEAMRRASGSTYRPATAVWDLQQLRSGGNQ